jgi:hypothetical protein
LNKTILFLSIAVTIAGLYFTVLKETELIPETGDLRLKSNTTSLTKTVVEFKVVSLSGKDLYIRDISGDCVIMPPAVALKIRNEYTLSGECSKLAVEDGTVDLIVSYKVKGEPEIKRQALKLYLNKTVS